jgi:cytochrome c-type biogenesis protein
LLAFFTPCVIPLLPVYLAFLGGTSLTNRRTPWKTVIGVLFFVLGLSIVLFLEGFLAGTFGSLLFRYQRSLKVIFGVLIVLMGLTMTGWRPLNFLQRERRLISWKSWQLPPVWSGLFLGFAFSLAWTPCAGPAMAAILSLAAASGDAWHGAGLLLIYSAGFALPFLLVAVFITGTLRILERIQPALPWIQRVAGLAFVVMGILLALDLY